MLYFGLIQLNFCNSECQLHMRKNVQDAVLRHAQRPRHPGGRIQFDRVALPVAEAQRVAVPAVAVRARVRDDVVLARTKEWQGRGRRAGEPITAQPIRITLHGKRLPSAPIHAVIPGGVDDVISD